MKKTYSTQQAAAKIGVGFRTLNRWLADRHDQAVHRDQDAEWTHALAAGPMRT